MGRLLLIGLVVLPIVEIAVFIKVGQLIGLLPTLLLVIGAALLGGFLLRQQGLSVLSKLRGDLQARRLPARAFLDAAMIGVAAVLLVLPGFLSDIVALLLLVPPVRALIYAYLAQRITVVATTATQRPFDPDGGRRVGGPGTIDLDDEDYRPR